jgi:FixJ family two-component response regulator
MGRAPTIAILDDEEHFRRAVARLLKACGYEVLGFAGGAEFLLGVSVRSVDCVLVDLDLPGMTGFEVLAQLRGMPDAPAAIVVTGRDDPGYARRARALGAFDYQLKPIGAPALLDAIRRACAR